MKPLLSLLLLTICLISTAQKVEWVELDAESDKSKKESEGYVGTIGDVNYYYESKGGKILEYDDDYNKLGSINIPDYERSMAYPNTLVLGGKLFHITYLPYIFKDKKVEMKYVDMLNAKDEHKILFEHPFVPGGMKLDQYDFLRATDNDSIAIVLLKSRVPVIYTVKVFDKNLKEVYSKEIATELEKTFRNSGGLMASSTLHLDNSSYLLDNGDIILYGTFTDPSVSKKDPNYEHTLLIHYDRDKDKIEYGHFKPKNGSGGGGGVIVNDEVDGRIYLMGASTEDRRIIVKDGKLNMSEPFFLMAYDVEKGRVIQDHSFTLSEEMKDKILINILKDNKVRSDMNGRCNFDIEYIDDDQAIFLVELDETVISTVTASSGTGTRTIYKWRVGDILVYSFRPSTGEVLFTEVIKKAQNKDWVKGNSGASLSYNTLEGNNGIYVIFNTSTKQGSDLMSYYIDKSGTITSKVLMKGTEDNPLVADWTEGYNVLYMREAEKKKSHRYLKIIIED